MQPAGEAVFAARRENKSKVYAYENRPAELPAALLEILRSNPAACAFFEAQPPSYRRTAVWQIVSAKQPATQRRRLDKLIAASAAGKRLF
ncbi:MAG: YdeI/OmpD-associated family protein [Gluconacetobacter diazotrophicus]|nr:YdeI/OmpD-associated family protein [Gluconacetobacter diazotrophicus]